MNKVLLDDIVFKHVTAFSIGILESSLSELYGVCEELKKAKRILVAGNGDCASICDHIQTDFTKQLHFKVINLCSPIGLFSALANDESYEQVFSRQVEIVSSPGDIFFVLSTSGNSKNIIAALDAAGDKGIKTVGFYGIGGNAKQRTDHSVIIPLKDTMVLEDIFFSLIHIMVRIIQNT